jgi:hypothetical protein
VAQPLGTLAFESAAVVRSLGGPVTGRSWATSLIVIVVAPAALYSVAVMIGRCAEGGMTRVPGREPTVGCRLKNTRCMH